MRYDIWYDLGSAASTGLAFGTWRLYTPQPKTPAEAGAAVEKILDTTPTILITVSPERDEGKLSKPRISYELRKMKAVQRNAKSLKSK